MADMAAEAAEFGYNDSTAEFRKRGRKLKASTKRKIAQALKGKRRKGGRKATAKKAVAGAAVAGALAGGAIALRRKQANEANKLKQLPGVGETGKGGKGGSLATYKPKNAAQRAVGNVRYGLKKKFGRG
jgi:hypothetical protein